MRASVIVCVLLGCASTAGAYCRTTTVATSPTFQPQGDTCWTEGSPVWWKDKCLSYGIEIGGSARLSQSTVSDVARVAFGAWNGLACASGMPTIKATEGPAVPVACTMVGYVKGAKNNVNEIIFHDDAWPYNDGVNTLALTTLTFNADTGQILDADIELNTKSNQITTDVPVPNNSFDLQSILTHEAGHYFGLAHSGHTDATMYSMYKPQSISMRTLTADDTAGFCAVYGTSNRPTSTGNVGAGDCSSPPRGAFDGQCPGAEKASGGCGIAPVRSAPDLNALFGAAALLAARARRAKRSDRSRR